MPMMTGEGGGYSGLSGLQGGQSLAQALPYLQALLGAYGAARGQSGTQQMAERAAGMSQPGGRDIRLPSQPGSQGRGQRTGRAVGEAALSAIPVAGPVASAVGGVYNAGVDRGDQEGYLKRLLAANPGMNPPGELDLEDTEINDAHKDTMRHGKQAIGEAMGGIFGGIAGAAVSKGLSRTREHKESEWVGRQQKGVRERNAAKISRYEGDMRAQAATAPGQPRGPLAGAAPPQGGGQQPDQAMLMYLMRVLQQGQGGQPRGGMPMPQGPQGYTP